MGRPMGFSRLAGEIGDEAMVAEKIGDQHRFAQRAERVHAVEKIPVINGVADLQLAQRHLEHDDGRFVLAAHLSRDELFLRAFQHVEHRVGERTETAAFEQHRFFVKQFAGDDGLAVGGEHGGFGEPLLDELQRHQTVVHAGESRAGKFDHVHLDALRWRDRPAANRSVSPARWI